LTSALDGSEWSASCPGHFTPEERGERTPRTHLTGGWVDSVPLPSVYKKIPYKKYDTHPCYINTANVM